jgi:hypothetical protein
MVTNTNEIQKIIREYFKNIYSNELENLEEMGIFLDATQIEPRVYKPLKQIYNKQ